MLVPISWLKEFVDIKLPLKDLMWKMTEVGLTCESYKNVGEDIVLDVEVTPNRPDWMSIIGVAREVAAIQGAKINEHKIKNIPEPKNILPLKLNNNFELFERWCGVIIKNIDIKPSPKWLADRIRLMGHEPINNIIDITNYVMYETGIPMHAFDYDEIRGQEMTVQKSIGEEKFVSVDNLEYSLPKNAIIIKDKERLIDLAGIKGGLNSGIKDQTKNIFLHVTIDNPVFVRRASLALGLRSEASAIYERGPNKGGVTNSLARGVELILGSAGGEIASKVFDIKQKEFSSWNLTLNPAKLEKVLGIKIPDNDVVKILGRLSLSPKKSGDQIKCTIPTYRGDLKIEEDLIEEVARIYGYNKFPKTIPEGSVSTQKNPYLSHFPDQQKLRQILISSGYSEVMNLSLISTELIENCLLDPKDYITIENPVSLDYEHLRASLIPNLLTAIKINRGERVKIFELDKVYPKENYKISAAAKGISFREFKGAIDLILDRLNIRDYKTRFEAKEPFWHLAKGATIEIDNDIIGSYGEINPQVQDNLSIKEKVYVFEFDQNFLQKHSQKVIFKPIPEIPAQIEDITLTFPPKTRIGEVVTSIWNLESRISNVELKDIYKDSYTFRVWYQDSKKTLTDKEVEEIRTEILKKIKSKYGGGLKE